MTTTTNNWREIAKNPEDATSAELESALNVLQAHKEKLAGELAEVAKALKSAYRASALGERQTAVDRLQLKQLELQGKLEALGEVKESLEKAREAAKRRELEERLKAIAEEQAALKKEIEASWPSAMELLAKAFVAFSDFAGGFPQNPLDQLEKMERYFINDLAFKKAFAKAVEQFMPKDGLRKQKFEELTKERDQIKSTLGIA